MTSPERFFLGILRIIIRTIWTVLFFLSSFSALALTNHFWTRILNAFAAAQILVFDGINYFHAL